MVANPAGAAKTNSALLGAFKPAGRLPRGTPRQFAKSVLHVRRRRHAGQPPHVRFVLAVDLRQAFSEVMLQQGADLGGVPRDGPIASLASLASAPSLTAGHAGRLAESQVVEHGLQGRAVAAAVAVP